MESWASVMDGVRITGWVLVSFLWQGVLLGMLYAVGRAALPRGLARYRLGMAVLLTLALCPVFTTTRLLQAAAVGQLTSLVVPSIPASPMPHVAASSVWRFKGLLDAALPWLVLAWAACVTLLSVRSWRQWRRLKVMVQLAEALPLWQTRVSDMADRFGLRRRISVLGSSLIPTPMLVGWVRPVILMPLAVAARFPVEQIELILAHELAHLRRWDPLANLFQVVLETLFFYHPVVHWVSRDVRNEREICCDDLALHMHGGSPRVLGTALAELGELRQQYGTLSVAATGGVLMDRVQQLVLPASDITRMRTPGRFTAVLAGVLLLAMIVRLAARPSPLELGPDLVLSPLPLIMTSQQWRPLESLAPALRLADMTLTRFVPRAVLPLADAGHEHLPANTALEIWFRPDVTVPATPIRISDPAAGTRFSLAAAASLTAQTAAARAPAPIELRQPDYPLTARLQHIQGEVELEFAVSAQGRVQEVQILKATPAGVFDQAARQAMQGWRFAAGAATRGERYRQTMVFSLARSGLKDGGPAATLFNADVSRRGICEMPTGSHICRPLGGGVHRANKLVAPAAER